MENYRVIKKINNTEFKYRILTCGSKFKIPTGQQMELEYQNIGYTSGYPCKSHATTVGRIDGLTEFYRESGLQVGDEIEVNFDHDFNTVYVKKTSQSEETFTNSTPSDYDIDLDLDLEEVIFEEPHKEEKFFDAELVKAFFDEMDPVVHHSEFYFGWRMEKSQYLAVNKNWIISRFSGDGLRLMDEDGDVKINLDHIEGKDTKDAKLWGINNQGVWFIKYKYYHDNEIPCKIICIRPWDGSKLEIKMNSRNAYIETQNIYIYDDQVYYISEKGTKSYVIKLLRNDFEQELFVANKNEKLSKLSVYGEQVAFKFVSKKDGGKQCWYFFSTYGFEEFNIEIPNRELDIKLVDLKKQIMWTALTQSELDSLNLLGKKACVARRLKPVLEHRYCSYKTSNTAATFLLPDKFNPFDSCYFDGTDYYESPHYSQLDRTNLRGERFVLGPMGHGETQKIVVSDKFLYVNYDASMPVRLPRKFKSAQLSAEQNLQALDLWGKNDYRL